MHLIGTIIAKGTVGKLQFWMCQRPLDRPELVCASIRARKVPGTPYARVHVVFSQFDGPHHDFVYRGYRIPRISELKECGFTEVGGNVARAFVGA